MAQQQVGIYLKQFSAVLKFLPEAFVAHRALKVIATPSSTCIQSMIRCLDHVIQPTMNDRSTSDELESIAQELTSSTWLSIIQSSLERPLKKSI